MKEDTEASITAEAQAEIIRQAVEHHRAGRLEEAGKLYQEILEVQPGHGEANHNLGVVAVGMGKAEAGLSYLMAALEADPSRGQYWLSYIDALYQAGQLEAAREVLDLAKKQGLEGEEVDALAMRLTAGEQPAEQGGAGNLHDGHAPAVSPVVLQSRKAETRTKTSQSDQSCTRAAQQHANETSTQSVDALVTLFSTGRYAEAEELAREMTVRFPLEGLGWKILGMVLVQMGRNAEALAPMQKAVAMMPADAQAHCNLGVNLRDLGRLAEAESSLQTALRIKPDYAHAHFILGATLQDMGRPADAEICYRRSLEIKPENAQAHNNLGVTLQYLGRQVEAEASLRRALEISPDFADAHNNLGNTLKGIGRTDEAEASYRRAIQASPNFSEAYYNLGIALHDAGRTDEAEASYRRAIQLRPESPMAYNNLGLTLKDKGRLDEAEKILRLAVQIKPDYADAHCNLGATLIALGRVDEAEDSYRRALEANPGFAQAYSNLGVALQELGRLDEAAVCYRKALEIKPDFVDAHGNLLFVLNYHPDLSAEEIYRVYREFDAQRGIPLRQFWRPHNNDRNPGRRLRVGYVSPDFRRHSCGSFLEPLLANHDKTQVELFAYAGLVNEDEMTTRYKSYVEHWITTQGMSDETLAERIRSDEIDILVDLAGHTAGNRLLVFARKPAPVSVSWLGYGYTTGLSAIDYYLTDEIIVPPGNEGLFAEQPWRIAMHSYTYRPAPGMGEVNGLPARQRGYLTFGTLTRSIRINHRTIRVWSQILKAVADSHLVIDSFSFKDPLMQERMVARFAEHGIARERLEIGCHSPPWDVLRGIDIGLDCFPHNSGTTLFETLYMGVPFITLVGRPSVGRLGCGILQTAGHPEWIASSEADYVAKAVELARNFDDLSMIRGALRDQIESSLIRDERSFVRKVEEAYRRMWTLWCEKVPA